VGRCLGVTLGRAVGVGLAVAVGVAEGVAVGVVVAVAVAVAVGVTVAVAVAVAVGADVGVGVGHGTGAQPTISTVSTRQLSLNPLVSLAILQRRVKLGRKKGRLTTVVIKPSELPLQARRPAIGLPRSPLIVRLYPPMAKFPLAARIS